MYPGSFVTRSKLTVEGDDTSTTTRDGPKPTPPSPAPPFRTAAR
jgi:hypothetical protein